MQVNFKIINPHAATPSYQTTGSAGLDLQACIQEPLTLAPNEVRLIGSGVAVHIKDPTFVGILTPRSGTGHKRGIVLGNGVGVIDSDYQGELKMSVWNRSTEPQTIQPYERIAQLLIVPVVQAQFTQVDEFEQSDRGASGFGSTGAK